MAQSSFFGQSILDYNAVADKFENFNYDYTAMANKPCINGHKLLGGENTLQYLGITDFVTGCVTGVCERTTALEAVTTEHAQCLDALAECVDAKSTVTTSSTGTSTEVINYITVDGCEKLLPGGAAGVVNTVNNKGPVSGNVTVTGSDIAVGESCATLVCDKIDDIDVSTTSLSNAVDNLSTSVESLATAVSCKSTVSVSATGSATDEVCYITINGMQHKLAGGGGGISIPRLAQFTYPVTAVESCAACYHYECVIGAAISTYIHSFSDIDAICSHTLLLNIDWTGPITADGLTATYERALQTVACVLPEKVSVFIPEEGMYQNATNINVRGTFMPYGELLCCCAPGNHTIEAYSYLRCYACYYPEKDCFTEIQLREIAVDYLDCTPESVSTCTKDELVQLFKGKSISDGEGIDTCTTGVYDTSLLTCASGIYDVTTCVSDGCTTFYVCPKS